MQKIYYIPLCTVQYGQCTVHEKIYKTSLSLKKKIYLLNTYYGNQCVVASLWNELKAKV